MKRWAYPGFADDLQLGGGGRVVILHVSRAIEVVPDQMLSLEVSGCSDVAGAPTGSWAAMHAASARTQDRIVQARSMSLAACGTDPSELSGNGGGC